MISIRRKKNNSHSRDLNVVQNGPFQFSSKVDYGLFLLTELSKNKAGSRPLSLRTVAKEHGLSFFFLQKIASSLRKAGIIEAVRGKEGGYILAKAPQELSLKEILEILEGPVAVMPCFNHGDSTCNKQNHCFIRPGLRVLNEIIVDALQKTTLQQLLYS